MRKIDIDELRRLAGSGWYIRKLAIYFGVSDNAIVGAGRRHKIDLPRCQLRKIDPVKLRELLKQRKPYSEIAKELGVVLTAVANYVKRNHPEYIPNSVPIRSADIDRMQRMVKNGVHSRHIVDFFGVPRTSIFRAIARKHGKGVRSPRWLGTGKVGERLSDDLIGGYSEVIRRLLYKRYPRNWEQVDAGVAFASATMQEYPEADGWKSLFQTIAQRQTVEEIRSTIGRHGHKIAVAEAEQLVGEVAKVESIPDDTAEFLREKIGELEEKFSDLLYTLLECEFNHGEAIQQLGIPESTYWARYASARNALRGMLPDELAETNAIG